MKRSDLRSRIIPTTIKNTNELFEMGNKKFNTTDLIYLDSCEEQNNEEMKRKILATDYALMNNAYAFNIMGGNKRTATYTWLRTAYDRKKIYCINGLRGLYKNKE